MTLLPVIVGWIRDIMVRVRVAPSGFRSHCDKSMLTINKASWVVVGPGQPAFDGKADEMHQFTFLPCSQRASCRGGEPCQGRFCRLRLLDKKSPLETKWPVI
jgi:hypothetical protein